MTQTTVSLLDAALSYAERGWPVIALHTPVAGVCDCPKRSACVSPGKHPRTQHGLDDATTDLDRIRMWWGPKMWPQANIGIDLVRAGLLDVAPDSIEWQAEFIARGLPRTAHFRSGGGDGHEHHLYRRPETCPAHRLCKPDEYDILSAGYAVMPPSLHASGQRYAWTEQPDVCPPGVPPVWPVDMLQDVVRSQHHLNSTNGTVHVVGPEAPVRLSGADLELWAGKLARVKPDGKVDRSGSLWDIGCALARGGASRSSIVHALQDRDETLGWSKYTGRRDAATRYAVLADRVLSGEGPRIRLKAAKPVPANVNIETGEVAEEWQWTVYDAPDFLARDIPAVEWLVEGYIRDQAIVGNFGGPGSLKTYFMSQLALSIATGERFLGRFATRQSKVLIVQEDTLEADYQQAYLRPMFKALGITPEDTRGWLYIAPSSNFLLDDAQRLAALEYWLAEHRPALVGLDAFYLLHTGEGMTSKDLQPVLTTLKRLRKTYGCAFWLLDHNRKSSGMPSSDESAMDRWYGGRSKSAASDAVIESQSAKGESGVSTFHVLKLRGAPAPAPLRVRLVDGALVVDENESDAASEGTKTLIIQWLITQASGRTINDIKLATRLGDRTVRRAASELAAQGRMVKVGMVGQAILWHLAEQAAGASQEGPWV